MIFLLFISYVIIFLSGFFLAIERYLNEKTKKQTKCKNCVYHGVCLIEEDLKLVYGKDKEGEMHCSLALEKSRRKSK